MSNQPGVLIKDVAESLCIHPFMLFRWRKEVRDGELVGKVAPIDTAAVAELKRLREVEQQYKRLRMEHELLSAPAAKSIPPSFRSDGGGPTPSSYPQTRSTPPAASNFPGSLRTIPFPRFTQCATTSRQAV